MNEVIKSLIFAILGAVVMGVGMFTNAGWEIIGLGAVIVIFALVCVIVNSVKRK